MNADDRQRWFEICRELKQLLNDPLPAGRGAIYYRDVRLQYLAQELAQLPIPRKELD